MTLLIASLFLPYTIDFDVKEPSSTSTSSRSTVSADPSLIRVDGSKDQALARFTTSPATTSSFTTSPDASPQPLSADDEENDVFIRKLTTSKTEPIISHNYWDIAPNELHSPAWGRTSFFNQPKLRPESIPPVSVLEQPRQIQKISARNAGRPTIPKDVPQDESHDQALKTAGWSVQPGEQGNSAIRHAVLATNRNGLVKDKKWVGTLGMPTDVLDNNKKADISNELRIKHDCLTVFPKDSDFDGHYSHFCKTILWPLFHYQIPDNPKSKAYLDHSWVYYKKINQLFADIIVENWKEGDTIWIHDYHLLLVPSMVRERIPDAEIGFFLHVAFPSSEVFRCLAARIELLQGLLGANLIGFQTQEYCNHFLQTCNRLLFVEATQSGVQSEERFVKVATFPIGIDTESLDVVRGKDQVKQWLKEIQKRYAGKHLIVARDKLDHVGGVRQKLLSYEFFLKRYPKFKEKVVLIQVATSTVEQAELEATVSDIVERINSQHSTLAHQPLIFLKQDIEQAAYLAMITAADALMITSLREGMNLTSHDFLYWQDGKCTDKKHGSLILSEFTGSSSVFGNDELSVNPWDYRQCAEAMHKALDMSCQEKEERWLRLMGSVKYHTAERWVSSFLEELYEAWDQNHRQQTFSIPRLPISRLSENYNSAKSRLFMLDFEGTLAEDTLSSVPYTSLQRTINTLNDLLEVHQNTVYVMSGWRPEKLDSIFRMVPRLGLIAENGCFLKESGSDTWLEAADMEKMEVWKKSIAKILRYYQERTEGSRIEERHCSLIFHYSGARDPQSAARLAGDCANHINEASHQSLNVHAVHFEGGVLIESMDWNKGTAAARIFDGLTERNGAVPPDFLMVAGNAREDEVIYRWANKLKESGEVPEVMTVSVGSRNTEAMATLNQGVTAVLSALRKLAGLADANSSSGSLEKEATGHRNYCSLQ